MEKENKIKLVAIWVEEYGCIKDQTFNLGSEFTYKFKYNKENKELKINRVKTPHYFNLFNDSKVINITGVIGVNGSGKTSLLKLLNVISAEKPLKDNIVLVYENDGHIEIKISDTQIMMSKMLKKEDIIICFKNNIDIKVTGDPFVDIDIVFFSNLYSRQNDKYLYDSNLNRSVDYQTRISLSYENVQNYIDENDKTGEESIINKEDQFDLISLYQNDKLKRQIKFLADIKTQHPKIINVINDIDFVEDVSIWFDENEIIHNKTRDLIKRSKSDLNKLLDILGYCFQLIDKEKKARKRFENQIIISLYYTSFYYDFFKKSRDNNLIEFEKNVENINLNDTIFSQLKQFILKQDTIQKSPIDKVKLLLQNIEDELRLFDIQEEKDIFKSSYAYRIGINDKLWGFLSKIFSISIYTNEKILNYSLTPLSSGQDAILLQFSELYEAINNCNKDNVIVSIDEGELYLHPEWQRKYINSLYQFFEFFGKEKTINFQLIITSHSPFIVSDIPNYNLIYLEKENGICKVSKFTENNKTLGGNIFELYSNEFFVKEFISEFAHKKITEAFIFFENPDKSVFKDLDEIEKFTTLIGERVIRDELKKRIDRTKSQGFDKYYEIIKRKKMEDESDVEHIQF